MPVLLSSTGTLLNADIHRFHVEFNPSKDPILFPRHPGIDINFLRVRVSNTCPLYKIASVLSGPFELSTSLHQEVADGYMCGKPQFSASIKCGQYWENKIQEGKWVIEVVSEVKFSENPITYAVTISTLDTPRSGIHSVIQSPALSYYSLETKDIFSTPLNVPNNSHLVVLTHGVLGTRIDFLYLYEKLLSHYDAKCGNGDNSVVPLACDSNHLGTFDGIEVAGRRIADQILTTVNYSRENESKKEDWNCKYSKISFIGHSLGGILNLYAIEVLQQITHGKFFDVLTPMHFVTLASPLLGSHLIAPLKWVLIGGLLGQTGKDLALATPANTLQEPLLLQLAHPHSACHKILRRFKSRSCYANLLNDPLVNYRTSSLLYTGCYDLTSKLTVNQDRGEQNSYSGDVVLMDQVVEPSDFERFVSSLEDTSVEIEIARRWHSDMAWRKILISLKGNAHESIVVRRRFINAAGEKVIEHIIREHPM
ncbi:uncharacterized protein VTP21DRAFT_4978 [Calcarisporiella thermophila]|uniref:uncharacterized protein n=1 Tax=Calcarisporiella thermophila TaxID=911321 RepID=UPI0037444908